MNFEKESKSRIFFAFLFSFYLFFFFGGGGGGGGGVTGGMNMRAAKFCIHGILSRPLLQNRIVS